MEKERIKEYINNIINNGHDFGIKVYTVLKILNKVELKELCVTDKLEDMLKTMIIENINSKILSDEIKIEDSQNISEQRGNCIYDIETSDSYNPFSFINDVDNCEHYDTHENNNISGFLFKINFNEKYFWAYQHVYAVTKIKKSNAFLLLFKDNSFDLFEDEIISISSKIDLIILENNIITDNIKLLQTHFGFDQFIRIEARKTVDVIVAKGMVSNSEKLINLIGQEKTTIAKKFMKAKNSPVLKIDNIVLSNRIRNHSRYKNMIIFDGEKIKTDTQKDVNNFLKMLCDDLLRSDLTLLEYDSETKIILD